MHYPEARTDLTPEVVAPLTEALERIGIHDIANQLWEAELSLVEQEQLGEDFLLRRLPEAYAALRGMSFERAILDLGVAADVVTPSRRRLLLKQLGEDESEAVTAVGQLPRFDSQTGHLYFNDQLIAKLQVRKDPSNLYCILDGFQRSGWKKVIANPMLEKDADTSIYKVLLQLNKKTAPIAFGVQGGGTQVNWQEKSDSEVTVNRY